MDSKPLNLFEMMSPNPPIAGTPITSHPNLRPNPGSDTPSRINHPEYPQPDQQQKPNPPTDPTTVDPSLPPPPQTSTVVESFNELKKFHWDKLSPEEFQQLHDLASCKFIHFIYNGINWANPTMTTVAITPVFIVRPGRGIMSIFTQSA